MEARLDSAFFSQHTRTLLDLYGVASTLSVPFERFPELKDQIESRKRWCLDEERSHFGERLETGQLGGPYRFIFVRRTLKRQIKELLQWDLFQPRQKNHDYRVLITNKRTSAHNVVLFPCGRGTQEGIFGEAKQHTGLHLIPHATVDR